MPTGATIKSAAKRSTTANIINEVMQQSSKTSHNMSKNTAALSKQIVHYGISKHLRGQLQRNYTKPSIAIDDIGRLYVVSYSRPAYFLDIEMDGKHKQTAT